MESVIRLENVNFEYLKGKPALLDISFEVYSGEILSIVGSNGGGKSTLLHLINGLIQPDSGKVYFKEKELTPVILKDIEFNSIFRSSMGYVFQHSDNQLFCPTVMDELLFAPQQLGKGKQECMERAGAVMEMLEITDLRDRPVHMLSGGEKKRVAIGSILTMNPEVILLDEPMNSLDPKSQAFLMEILFQLNSAGKTIVIATHQLELIDHVDSRVVVLSELHRVEKIAQAREILTDTELLIRTNLIHAQWHRHGNSAHYHLTEGLFLHRHEK